MWINLFKAEIFKIGGNRGVTGFLIWSWPALGFAFMLIYPLLYAVLPIETDSLAESPPQWTDMMVQTWNIPNGIFGRLLLIGFTAVMFGGEYQWNTWKSIIPRSWRIPLLIVKFVTMCGFVVVAFTLTSILLTIGQGLGLAVIDIPYGPAVTSDVLKEFIQDYLLQMLVTIIAVIIAAGFTALGAMITRSILGSLIIGFILSLAESLSLVAFALVAFLLNDDSFMRLFHFAPTYNLLNIMSWVNNAKATPIFLPNSEQEIGYSLESSLLILFLWVMGLIVATVIFFQQQDITN